MTVRLEPFGEADFDRLIGWIPDAACLLQWAGPSFAFPLDRAQLSRHLEAARAALPTLVPCRAVKSATGEVFGHVELANLQRAHGSAVLCRVLVGPTDERGRGLGRQMVRRVLRLGFADLGLHRISLNVFTHNRAALACYQSLGFRVEGTARESCRVG
ncbi:MAG: GNAT family protein, partial [Gemmatimonadota bacterium]